MRLNLDREWQEIVQTWSQHAVNGPLLVFRRGLARLTRWAGVGCGGWRVGFWRKLGRRVAIRNQDLGGTQETDAVQARQDHGLFDYFLTHGAVQLVLQALHVRLLEAKRERMTIFTGWKYIQTSQKGLKRSFYYNLKLPNYSIRFWIWPGQRKRFDS